MLRQLLWASVLCVWEICQAQDFLQRECNTQPCKEVEKYLLSHINTSLEPCTNFLEYSCKNNITGSAFQEASNGDEYFFDNRDKSKHTLADDFHYFLNDYFNAREQPNLALTWEQAVYAKCRENFNVEKNENYYKNQLGDGKRLYRNVKADYYFEKLTRDSWTVTDRQYAKKGIGFAFFDFNVVTLKSDDQSAKEETRYIQISPMSDKPLIINEFFYAHFNVTYDTQITKYKQLKDFIIKLNEITPRPTDVEVHVERKVILDWQKEWDTYATATQLNWITHLEHIGFDLRSNDVILVKNKPYFQALAQKLHITHTETIRDFVHLRYVMKTIGFVKPEFRKYAIVPHIKGLHCTPGLMIGVVHAFQMEYFRIENKGLMKTMYNELLHNIERNLRESDDKDQYLLKNEFLRKLRNANVVIGYPDWMNSSVVTTLYSTNKYTVSESFFQNQMNALESLLKSQVQSYNEHGKLLITEMVTYYKSLELEDFTFDAERKEIIIPLSMFNEHTYRYFSNLFFNPINYASAGTAIAQKLYFAYLSEISYGLMTSRIPRCIKDAVNNHHVSKQTYYLESASWLLALKEAYRAWPDPDGLPIKFERFGAISPKRLFYIIFAQTLCRLPNSESSGPAKYINFAVANTKGFQEAFRCEQVDKHFWKNRNSPCNPLQY